MLPDFGWSNFNLKVVPRDATINLYGFKIVPTLHLITLYWARKSRRHQYLWHVIYVTKRWMQLITIKTKMLTRNSIFRMEAVADASDVLSSCKDPVIPTVVSARITVCNEADHRTPRVGSFSHPFLSTLWNDVTNYENFITLTWKHCHRFNRPSLHFSV